MGIRTIEFRGFHECNNGGTDIIVGNIKKRGEWVEGYFDCFWGMNMMIVCPYKYPIQIISETVGQFTWLMDKNGKKIFEGDIIKKGFQILEVLWNENQSKFDLYDFEGNVVAGFNKETSTFFEICGNAWENSDLIGDESNG